MSGIKEVLSVAPTVRVKIDTDREWGPRIDYAQPRTAPLIVVHTDNEVGSADEWDEAFERRNQTVLKKPLPTDDIRRVVIGED